MRLVSVGSSGDFWAADVTDESSTVLMGGTQARMIGMIDDVNSCQYCSPTRKATAQTALRTQDSRPGSGFYLSPSSICPDSYWANKDNTIEIRKHKSAHMHGIPRNGGDDDTLHHAMALYRKSR